MLVIPGQPDIERAKGSILGQIDLLQPDGFARLQVKTVEPAPVAIISNLGVAGDPQPVKPVGGSAEPTGQLHVAKFAITQDDYICFSR